MPHFLKENRYTFNMDDQCRTDMVKAAISPRIVLVPIVPDPLLVDRPPYCENSLEHASTVEHYPIPSGEDLARSPQSSEGRVPKK